MNGAGDGNRTHVTSLEGWGFTIKLHPQSHWWKGKDSNFRRLTSTDLQSVAFNHSATLPTQYCNSTTEFLQ